MTEESKASSGEAGRLLPAAHGYAPWIPPFLYNRDGQWIEDIRGHRILDMRGWGYLTGKGSEALGLDEDEAAKIQDAIGTHVADLMNRDDAKGHNDGAKTRREGQPTT